MKSLSTICILRKTVFDKSKCDTVFDISDLVENKIKPEGFFEENFLTQVCEGFINQYSGDLKDFTMMGSLNSLCTEIQL